MGIWKKDVYFPVRIPSLSFLVLFFFFFGVHNLATEHYLFFFFFCEDSSLDNLHFLMKTNTYIRKTKTLKCFSFVFTTVSFCFLVFRVRKLRRSVLWFTILCLIPLENVFYWSLMQRFLKLLELCFFLQFTCICYCNRLTNYVNNGNLRLHQLIYEDNWFVSLIFFWMYLF